MNAPPTPPHSLRHHRTGRAVVALCGLLFLATGPLLAHPPAEERLEALDRQVAAAPSSAALRIERAHLHLVLGDLDAALADCAAAERLDGAPAGAAQPVDRAPIHLIRAEIALARHRPAGALEHLDRFLAAHPDDAPGLALRGRILLLLGHPAQAADAFGRAIDQAPAAGPELRLDRARALAAAGRTEAALDHLLATLDHLGPVPALADEARSLAMQLGRSVTIPAAPAAAVAAPSSGQARSAPRVGTGAPAAAVPPVDLVRGPYLQEVTPTSAVVRWGSEAAALGRVRYGTAPGRLDGLAEEAVARTAHQVTLRGLPSGTRIYYALVPTAEAAPGAPDGSFLTAPPPGGDKPTRIWVVGDSGSADAAARDVRDAYRDFSAARPADLWLMLGDNAYSKGTDEQYQAAVFDTYPEELRTLPLWPTLGNHDAFSADSETGSGVYYDLFTLPREGEAGGVPSGTEAYYSFDYGTIHFLCLNSHDVDRSPDGAMVTWLRADLAAARDARWIIAYWHHPPYTKGSHDSDVEMRSIEMREWILPVLEEGGVDLVLTGHSHAYERSFLVDGHYGPSDSLQPSMVLDGGDGRPEGDGAYQKPSGGPAPHEGAVYVVAGSSGKVSSRGDLNHPVMALSLRELGSLVLDIDGPRLDATFLTAQPAGVGDTFTLLKGAPPPPVDSPEELLTDPDFPGFRFAVRITDQTGTSRLGAAEPACVPQTLCVSGALPGRTEVMVRIAGPKPNGFLWPSVARLSTSRIEVWIEQVATGTIRYYLLHGARPGVDELPGLFDRHGFQPAAP